MPLVLDAMGGGAVDIAVVRGGRFLSITGGERWKDPTALAAQQERED